MQNALETTFTFRNMDSTDALRDHTNEKLEKLDKYLVRPAAAHVIFKFEGAEHVAEITLNIKGGRFVGTEASNDMYNSIDGAIEKLKKQLSKQHERVKGHKGE